MLSLPSTITLAVVMCIVFNCVVCDNTMEGIDAKFAAEEPKNDIERFARSSPLRWGKRAPGKVSFFKTQQNNDKSGIEK